MTFTSSSTAKHGLTSALIASVVAVSSGMLPPAKTTVATVAPHSATGSPAVVIKAGLTSGGGANDQFIHRYP